MRVFRMIATPIMLLGLLGLLIWGGLWGWRNLTAPLPTPEPEPCVPVELEVLAPEHVMVNVYNGGYTRGLAERAATALRDNGFNVDRVTNTEEPVSNTIIRGREDGSLDAMVLAEGSFVDVELQFDDRIDGTIDLLVGTEFAGYQDEPSESVETEGRGYCMPAVISETQTPEPTDEATEGEDENSDE